MSLTFMSLVIFTMTISLTFSVGSILPVAIAIGFIGNGIKMIIDGKKVSLNWLPKYYDDNDEEIAALKKRQEREVDYISFRRAGTKNLHYAL